MQQFTPHSWTAFEWDIKTFKGFLAVLAIIYLEIQVELNAFYLKYLLWIPVSSQLNLYRLLFLFVQCLPATREAYQFLSDPKCKRLGMHAWMTTMIIITELVICIKFSKDEFPEPFPLPVIYGWAVALILLGVYAFYKFGSFSSSSKLKRE